MREPATDKAKKVRHTDRCHSFLNPGAFLILTACDLRMHESHSSCGTHVCSSQRDHIGEVD